MIAATAFLQVVSKDIYEENADYRKLLGGNGPHVFNYNSQLALLTRGLLFWALCSLCVLLTVTFVLQFDDPRQYFFGNLSDQDLQLPPFVLRLHIGYYLLLSIIIFLMCRVRADGIISAPPGASTSPDVDTNSALN